MRYKLGDIAPIRQGNVADEDEYWLLNLDMVESNTGRIIDYLTVPKEEIGNSTVTFDTKNVLYSKLRPYLNKVVLPQQSGYATSEMLPLRPDKNVITREYLTYFLRSPKFVGYINEKTGGAKMPRANISDLKAVEIDCPDIDVQKKITEAFDRLTDIIAKRQQELIALDDLIKARFVEMFGDAVANPKKWPVKKLKDLSVQINSGNTPKGGSENYVKEGIAFFRSQNVWKNRLEMEDIAYIDAKTHANMKRSSLKHGDILMTKTGRINTENSSLGRAALYLGEDDMANVNGHVYFIRLKPGVSNMFVLRILVSPEYVDLIRGVCVGGIDKRQLNKEHIEDFPIICPPTDMVNEYVKFVCQVDKSKLLSLIKLLEQLITYLYNVFIIYRQDKGEEVEDHE